ncbi:MAG: phosphoribosyltransferase family protein [Thermoleophilia bacterium]
MASQVARALGAPLDVLVVRKLGMPGHEELAMGAIASGGAIVVNDDVVDSLRVGRRDLEAVVQRELAELHRRERRYRGDRPALALGGRTVVLVDDGLATGSTMAAAVEAVRQRGVGRLIVAVPVGSWEACHALRKGVDGLVCLRTPEPFFSVGTWFRDFGQVGDDEVCRLLAASEAQSVVQGEAVALHLDGLVLAGELTVPPGATGLVLFAHGSGSSHRSPRNRAVAATLQAAGLATLLFDLLDEREEGRRDLVFDIDLLAARLVEATRWAASDPRLAAFSVGYFGASTGAAAALRAAAVLGDRVAAVVSRGGRPDLAAPILGDVVAPTLLVVGGRDAQVLALNRQAAAELRCPHEVVIVEGATHLFEEPGTLEQVGRLAADWFVRYVGGRAPVSP